MDIMSILAVVAPETYRLFSEMKIEKANDKELMIIMLAAMREEQKRTYDLIERTSEMVTQNSLKIDQLMRR